MFERKNLPDCYRFGKVTFFGFYFSLVSLHKTGFITYGFTRVYNGTCYILTSTRLIKFWKKRKSLPDPSIAEYDWTLGTLYYFGVPNEGNLSNKTNW